MKEFLEEEFSIHTNDADFNNRLKVNSIFVFLQDIAATHADKLQLGYNNLLKKNLGWVLSWVRVEIEKYPKYAETIKIKTWPKCKYKLYYMRDFLIYDEKENVIIKATTAWLPINIKTKRIADLQSMGVKLPDETKENALTAFPEKIISSEGNKIVDSKVFKYSDLDLNQHVNNTKYVEMILDCFLKDFHSSQVIKNIAVSFQAESFFGDEVEVSMSNQSSTELIYIVEAKNKVSGKTVFQSIIEWIKND